MWAPSGNCSELEACCVNVNISKFSFNVLLTHTDCVGSLCSYQTASYTLLQFVHAFHLISLGFGGINILPLKVSPLPLCIGQKKGVLFAWESKMISISKAEHLPSFWNRGQGKLGNGLLSYLSISKTCFIAASVLPLWTMMNQVWRCKCRVSDVSSHEVSSCRHALMWHTVIVPSLVLVIVRAVHSLDYNYALF